MVLDRRWHRLYLVLALASVLQTVATTQDNGILFQGFEWYVPADQKHWNRLQNVIPAIKAIGVDNLWIPPASKASNPEGNGYDVYDLYDVGEFSQKGSVATKWGTKAELQSLVNTAQQNGIGIIWDAVLNHRTGADELEYVTVVEVADQDRNENITQPYSIRAWLHYSFPGRGTQYSSTQWNWTSFTGTNFNVENNKSAIYKLNNKHWSSAVDRTDGNADYLLLNDVDYSNPAVQEDVKNWSKWVVEQFQLGGFRFDAVAHYSQDFQRDMLNNLDKAGHSNLFYVGEYLVTDTSTLTGYLDRMGHRFSLFDFPLMFNMSAISQQDGGDLQNILRGTLVSQRPDQAVTVVTNHDSQPGQTVQAPIADWFKPLAYALILLRQGGYPEIFYGDLYGTQGPNSQGPCCNGHLADIAMARKLYANGEQVDSFDERTSIGWVRKGTRAFEDGMAVVMSSKDSGQKTMNVGSDHAGEEWTDILGNQQGTVKIDQGGNGVFRFAAKSVSIWAKADANGRDGFAKL